MGAVELDSGGMRDSHSFADAAFKGTRTHDSLLPDAQQVCSLALHPLVAVGPAALELCSCLTWQLLSFSFSLSLSCIAQRLTQQKSSGSNTLSTASTCVISGTAQHAWEHAARQSPDHQHPFYHMQPSQLSAPSTMRQAVVGSQLSLLDATSMR